MTTRWTAQVTLVLAAGALLVAFNQVRNHDVAFCRAVLSALAQGRPAVQKHIAWDRLAAMGVDVGATYSELADAQEQGAYRQAFIRSFAAGFRQSGGELQAFRNWRRVESREGGARVVAVDYPAKRSRLLLFVARSGPRRLEAIQWQ